MRVVDPAAHIHGQSKETAVLKGGARRADEYAARHGRQILVWGYGGYRYSDMQAQEWAARVADLLFTPGLLDDCEEDHRLAVIESFAQERFSRRDVRRATVEPAIGVEQRRQHRKVGEEGA